MEINQIKAELKNSDDIQLRFKIDLIEKFLDKVVPKLDADTSIDDAYNNFVQKERTAEITAFAKEHDINADFLQNEISDYEYTGIISKAKIMQTIKKSFLEKAKIATLAVNFIKNNVQKYL